MGTARTSGTAAAGSGSAAARTRPERLWPYALMGLYLGVVFTRGEVVSWFRIQEMFRFQSFHMYGIIGAAVVTAAIGVALIRRQQAASFTGRPIDLGADSKAKPGRQHWLGGVAFGLGWGLIGACPGPIYTLIGNGVTVMVVALVSAVMGAWAYGTFRHHLPHA